jgi:hypothetical protein
LRVLLALAIVLLLSGCAAPAAREEVTRPTPSPIAPFHPPPYVASFPFAWNGTLGITYWLCLAPNCTAVVDDGDSDVQFNLYASNFTGAQATVEWQADTPATAQLGIAVRLVGGPRYNGCDDQLLFAAEGPSPLHLDWHGRIYIPPVCLTQVLVYNPTLRVDQPPRMVYATADQAFVVSGSLTHEWGSGNA